MLAVKEFLQECRYEYKELQDLEMQRQQLRLRLLPGAMNLKEDMVQTSPSGDMIGEVEAAVQNLEQIIQYDIRRIALNQTKARIIVDRVQDSQYRRILTQYYCPVNRYFESLNQMAQTMGYSYDWIRHVHGEALLAADKEYLKIIKDSTKKHSEM